MADIPEVPNPNRNEENVSQLTGKIPQKTCLTSSTPGVQQPGQFVQASMNPDIPSETEPIDQHSCPACPLDIVNCDLKSEDITPLMAEKNTSSDSEGSSENRYFGNVSEASAGSSTSEITLKRHLDEGTMQSWLADGSDSSEISLGREPLIPPHDESDMEEFGEIKDDIETTNPDNEKEESIVSDLINLKESNEKVIEPTSNQTDITNENQLNVENEAVPNQIVIANKDLVGIKIEPISKQTAVTDKHLLDMKIEETATTNTSLLDMTIEETAIANKSLLDMKTEETVGTNKSNLDMIEEETAVTNKSHLDMKVEKAVGTDKSLLDIKIEETDEADKNLLDMITEETAVTNKTFLDMNVEETAGTNKSLVDVKSEQIAGIDKSLLDMKIEEKAGTVKNLLDMITKETAVTNKNLRDMKNNETAVTNKSILDLKIEEAAVTEKIFRSMKGEETVIERKKDLETEKCARVCIDHIKHVLKNVYHDLTDTDSSKVNGQRTLDEKLRVEAEANILKRTLSRPPAEIGLPKRYINDADRVIEIFSKNIKKIGVYSGKLQTSFDDLSDGSNIRKECNDLFQSVKTIEGLEEAIHRTDSNDSIDVATTEDSVTLNSLIEHTPGDTSVTAIVKQNSTVSNVSSKPVEDQRALEKTMEDYAIEKPTENKTETDDATGEQQKSAVIKSILKNQRRVTFADKKGDPGMEHMALHHEESPKIEESQLDMGTPLRFMTETYPSHEDEETLSESFNATLEPCALSRPRRGSPRAKELYEELRILEGEESLSVSPCQSPEKSEFPDSTSKDNKSATNKPRNKFSKFFKSVKKKIWS